MMKFPFSCHRVALSGPGDSCRWRLILRAKLPSSSECLFENEHGKQERTNKGAQIRPNPKGFQSIGIVTSNLWSHVGVLEGKSQTRWRGFPESDWRSSWNQFSKIYTFIGSRLIPGKEKPIPNSNEWFTRNNVPTTLFSRRVKLDRTQSLALYQFETDIGEK